MVYADKGIINVPSPASYGGVALAALDKITPNPFFTVSNGVVENISGRELRVIVNATVMLGSNLLQIRTVFFSTNPSTLSEALRAFSQKTPRAYWETDVIAGAEIIIPAGGKLVLCIGTNTAETIAVSTARSWWSVMIV